MARLPGHGRGHHPRHAVGGAPTLGFGPRAPRAAHLGGAVPPGEPHAGPRAAPEGRRPADGARRPRRRLGRGQPVLPRGAGDLAHRLGGRRPRLAAVADRGRAGRPARRAPVAQGPAPGAPRRADVVGTRCAATSLGRRPDLLGRRGHPPGSGRRRARTPPRSTTCSRATSSSSASSPRSTRPASSSSSTPCCATWPTTASCAPDAASTTGGPPAGSPTSPPARDASRSMRRSSPSTSTWPTTPRRRPGTCGPAVGPAGCSPSTRRPTCSSAPSSWCRPTTRRCGSTSSPNRSRSWTVRATGPPKRRSCAGWPNCPIGWTTPTARSPVCWARAGRRSRPAITTGRSTSQRRPQTRLAQPASAPGWPRGTSGRGRRSPGTARARPLRPS